MGDSFPERLDLPVEQLLVAYMSRAGNVPLDRFAASSPEVVQRALEQWSGEECQQRHAADDERQGSHIVGPLAQWVLSRPLRPSTPGQDPEVVDGTIGPRGFDFRVVPDDPAAVDATVLDVGTDDRPAGREETVEDAVHRGASITGCVWLTGGDDRASVLTRLEIAERLRRRTEALVVVAGPEGLSEDLADGLVADRTHLVALR